MAADPIQSAAAAIARVWAAEAPSLSPWLAEQIGGTGFVQNLAVAAVDAARPLIEAAAPTRSSRGRPMSTDRAPIIDQPPPVATGGPSILALVRADLEDREQVGIARYGTPLQAHNGRDALVDAYQEALDLAAYLRQAIEERNRPLEVPDAAH